MSAIAQAYQLYQAGRHVEAETVLQSHLNAHGRDAKGHHLMAIILKAQSKFGAAEKSIGQAVKLAPGDENILLERAQILRDARQMEEAVRAADQLLRRSPGQSHANLIAGNYWLSQDFPEKALAYFDKGLAANPGHRALAYGRIFALKDLGQQAAAWEAITSLGSPVELLYTMGQLHMENFEPREAMADFKRSLAQGQNIALSARDLWQCSYMSGGREALDKSIEEVLSQYPNEAGIYVQIADMMTELGDTAEALQVAQRLEGRFGAQAVSSRLRAAAYEQAGQRKDAFSFAQKAYADMPGDIGAAMLLGRTALAEGAADRALELAETQLIQDRHQSSFWLAIKATALRLQGTEDLYAELVDYERMIGVYDLDPPQGYDTLEAFMAALKAHLISLHEWNEQPLFQSLRKGTQTTSDLRHDQAPVMRAFFEAIDKYIHDFIGNMPDHSEHAFYGRKTGKYRMSGAWSVALKPGGFHVNHIHPKGWISSSFYVDVPDSVADHPDKAGWIKFGEPPFQGTELGPEKYICPKPGRLVLFPSYFWHGTVPFTEGERRITLPFDLMPLD